MCLIIPNVLFYCCLTNISFFLLCFIILTFSIIVLPQWHFIFLFDHFRFLNHPCFINISLPPDHTILPNGIRNIVHHTFIFLYCFGHIFFVKLIPTLPSRTLLLYHSYIPISLSLRGLACLLRLLPPPTTKTREGTFERRERLPSGLQFPSSA